MMVTEKRDGDGSSVQRGEIFVENVVKAMNWTTESRGVVDFVCRIQFVVVLAEGFSISGEVLSVNLFSCSGRIQMIWQC